MKKKWIVVFSAVSSSLINQGIAGTMGSLTPPTKKAWVVTVSGGPTWFSSHQTQTLFLTPSIEKRYVSKKSTAVLGEGELFAGLQYPFVNQWQGQLGFAYGTTSSANAQGYIWDDAAAEFQNYSYRYKIRNNRIAVKGKLLYDLPTYVTPWLSASLGVGLNQSYGFQNTPLIFEAEANNNFKHHMQTSFSYSIGAGVQKPFNQHWTLGVGYEFSDWGKSQLTRAVGQTMNQGLTLNHAYTNGILFNITYTA